MYSKIETYCRCLYNLPFSGVFFPTNNESSGRMSVKNIKIIDVSKLVFHDDDVHKSIDDKTLFDSKIMLLQFDEHMAIANKIDEKLYDRIRGWEYFKGWMGINWPYRTFADCKNIDDILYIYMRFGQTHNFKRNVLDAVSLIDILGSVNNSIKRLQLTKITDDHVNLISVEDIDVFFDQFDSDNEVWDSNALSKVRQGVNALHKYGMWKTGLLFGEISNAKLCKNCLYPFIPTEDVDKMENIFDLYYYCEKKWRIELLDFFVQRINYRVGNALAYKSFRDELGGYYGKMRVVNFQNFKKLKNRSLQEAPEIKRPRRNQNFDFIARLDRLFQQAEAVTIERFSIVLLEKRGESDVYILNILRTMIKFCEGLSSESLYQIKHILSECGDPSIIESEITIYDVLRKCYVYRFVDVKGSVLQQFLHDIGHDFLVSCEKLKEKTDNLNVSIPKKDSVNIPNRSREEQCSVLIAQAEIKLCSELTPKMVKEFKWYSQLTIPCSNYGSESYDVLEMFRCYHRYSKGIALFVRDVSALDYTCLDVFVQRVNLIKLKFPEIMKIDIVHDKKGKKPINTMKQIYIVVHQLFKTMDDDIELFEKIKRYGCLSLSSRDKDYCFDIFKMAYMHIRAGKIHDFAEGLKNNPDFDYHDGIRKFIIEFLKINRKYW